ncbi:MAG: hypothetical protein C4527_00625 [Candidatus Omnitrophota bacterium]|jgi:hypothetical protein|nr:MAG: hypothetical protein C4527_00625 [Candidatus Omnitrophota bacterium]
MNQTIHRTKQILAGFAILSLALTLLTIPATAQIRILGGRGNQNGNGPAINQGNRPTISQGVRNGQENSEEHGNSFYGAIGHMNPNRGSFGNGPSCLHFPRFALTHVIQLSGTISAMEGTNVSILGGAVIIESSGAEIIYPPANNEEEPALQIGDRIQVIAKIRNDGSLAALAIRIMEPIYDGTIAGVIESIDADNHTITVAGQIIQLNDETVVRLPRRLSKEEDFSLEVGNLVRIHINTSEESPLSLLAVRITVMFRPTIEDQPDAEDDPEDTN